MTKYETAPAAVDRKSVHSAGAPSIDWDGVRAGTSGEVWNTDVVTNPPNPLLEAVHTPYAASSRAVRAQVLKVSELRLGLERQRVGRSVGKVNISSAVMHLKQLRDRSTRRRLVAVAKFRELLCISRGDRIVELARRCEAASANLPQAKDLERELVEMRADNQALREELSEMKMATVREEVVIAQHTASYMEDSPVNTSSASSHSRDGSSNEAILPRPYVCIMRMKLQLMAERALSPDKIHPTKLSTSVADLYKKYDSSIRRVGKL